MRTLFFLMLCLALCLPARASNFIYTIVDGNQNPITNHQCYLQPMTIPTATNNAVAIGGKLPFTTDPVTGSFTQTNPIVNCLWQLQVVSPPTQQPAYFLYPANLVGDTNTYYAATYLTNYNSTNAYGTLYQTVVANGSGNGQSPISTNGGSTYFWAVVSGGGQSGGITNIVAGAGLAGGGTNGTTTITTNGAVISTNFMPGALPSLANSNGNGGSFTNFGGLTTTNLTATGPTSLQYLTFASGNVSGSFQADGGFTAPSVVTETNQSNVISGTFIGNGAGLTNTEGFNTNTSSTFSVNTNQVILTGFIDSGINGVYKWNASLTAYTNGGSFSIYFDATSPTWCILKGTSIIGSTNIYCETAPPQSEQDASGFPFNWYINNPTYSYYTDIGTPPPGNGYFGVTTNAAAVRYVQAGAVSASTYFSNGVGGLSYLSGQGNVIINQDTNYPNNIMGGQNNLAAGFFGTILNSTSVTDYGIRDMIMNSSLGTIWQSSGGACVLNCENFSLNSFAGVCGLENSADVTNNCDHDCGIYDTVTGTIDFRSATSSILFGQTLYLQGNSSGIGGANISVSNFNNGFAFGANLAGTNTTNSGVLGFGLTNNSSGTVKIGETNANTTYSNATATHIGTQTNTGNVGIGGNLNVSGTVTLPAASIANAALQSTVALTSQSNAFASSQSMSNATLGVPLYLNAVAGSNDEINFFTGGTNRIRIGTTSNTFFMRDQKDSQTFVTVADSPSTQLTIANTLEVSTRIVSDGTMTATGGYIGGATNYYFPASTSGVTNTNSIDYQYNITAAAASMIWFDGSSNNWATNTTVTGTFFVTIGPHGGFTVSSGTATINGAHAWGN